MNDNSHDRNDKNTHSMFKMAEQKRKIYLTILIFENLNGLYVHVLIFNVQGVSFNYFQFSQAKLNLPLQLSIKQFL
jgi:hypothetical protein